MGELRSFDGGEFDLGRFWSGLHRLGDGLGGGLRRRRGWSSLLGFWGWCFVLHLRPGEYRFGDQLFAKGLLVGSPLSELGRRINQVGDGELAFGGGWTIFVEHGIDAAKGEEKQQVDGCRA